MPRKVKLKPRIEPKQRRSLELRQAILDGATYVLKKEGAYGFTTNKVAERAGVNIASLYQYYPNKESLLFHLHEIEWEETWAKLQAVLDEPKLSVRERLHKLTLVFFFTEAEESELRLALKSAEVLYQNSKEYREMRTRAFRRVLEFMRVALKDKDEAELAFKTEFIMTLITSFAEAATSSKVDETKLRKQALLLSEMINGYFQI
jgi:AcrR family transcriptional regulator